MIPIHRTVRSKPVNDLDILEYARKIQPFLNQLKLQPDATRVKILINDLFVNQLNKVLRSTLYHQYVIKSLLNLENNSIIPTYKLAILLLQHLPDYIWYFKLNSQLLFSHHNSHLIHLPDLAKEQISFQYHLLDQTWTGRLKRFVKHRLFKFKLYSVGMQTPKAHPAMIALLNDINRKINKILGVQRIRIQVNSIYRSEQHQARLCEIGYAATPFSSHCMGLAADIEQSYYRDLNPDIHKSLSHVLSRYYKQQIINLIDSDSVWHLCLNPAGINYYTSRYYR